MNLKIPFFISILVLNLALNSVADMGPYSKVECTPLLIGVIKENEKFAVCRDLENKTTQKFTNSTEENALDVYCEGLQEATKCFVDTVVEKCDIYAARDYMKEHLPKNDLDMTGIMCKNFAKYLKENGIDKDCDEKIESNQNLTKCRQITEDAFEVASQEADLAKNPAQFSSKFCSDILDGLRCLYDGYLGNCDGELALAHLKDYAKIPEQVDLSDPKCQELQTFMNQKGVHPTQIPDISASTPTVPDKTEASIRPSHAVDSSTTSATDSTTTSVANNHSDPVKPSSPVGPNNDTSSSPLPRNPGNSSSPKPGNTDGTTEHNGAASAEIFSLEKLTAAVITVLLSYAAAKH